MEGLQLYSHRHTRVGNGDEVRRVFMVVPVAGGVSKSPDQTGGRIAGLRRLAGRL